MTYAAALEALARRQECRVRLGLARLRRSLARLGDPQKSLACLHVAGTNGKGSTCAILESVLRAAGYRTGLYLSPHLSDVRERIQVDGRPISRPGFARCLGRALAADPGEELTYFELLTAAAFLHFREEKTQAVVLETGLGGRLDATNAVPRPLASVITSLSFDHMDWLGTTLPRIAAEKAGIVKPGVPVFCADLPAAVMSVVRRRAAQQGTPLTVVRRPWKTVSVRWRDNRQTLSDGSRRCELSLLGQSQGSNAALARAVLDGLRQALPVTETAWREGLCRVRLPGRFQVVRAAGKTAIVDGAHNPEAIARLLDTLRASPWGRRRVRWVLGFMKDKDRAAMLHLMAPRLRDVVAVAPPSPRALSAAELAAQLRRLAPRAATREAGSAEAAVRGWLADAAAPSTAVVCGSFYLAAAALKALEDIPDA